MTELQQTEFQILFELDKVCKKLEIPYFLVCGSALGAVKYGGFIPWDDDIDVAMYRQDYERFLQEAPARLPANLFLQNFKTDPGFPQIYSKLRNSNTTFIEKTAAKLPIHQGVFIDIFPLDGYPRKRFQQKWLEFRKHLYNSMLLSAFDLPRVSTLQRLWRMLGISTHTATVAGYYDRMIRRYEPKESELLCNHGNWQGVLDYAPKSYFDDGVNADFSGLSVRVPVQYDAYLRRKYGNYEDELPSELQTGHHTYAVCDCTRSFLIYTNTWRQQEK